MGIESKLTQNSPHLGFTINESSGSSTSKAYRIGSKWTKFQLWARKLLGQSSKGNWSKLIQSPLTIRRETWQNRWETWENRRGPSKWETREKLGCFLKDCIENGSNRFFKPIGEAKRVIGRNWPVFLRIWLKRGQIDFSSQSPVGQKLAPKGSSDGIDPVC
jgi:hypothetical protein